jgi:hypothetical protein
MLPAEVVSCRRLLEVTMLEGDSVWPVGSASGSVEADAACLLSELAATTAGMSSVASSLTNGFWMLRASWLVKGLSWPNECRLKPGERSLFRRPCRGGALSVFYPNRLSRLLGGPNYVFQGF